MSAIWGIIKKKDDLNIHSMFLKMGTSMSVFPFDRTDIIETKNAYFACGHQYITAEDEHDTSPISDESHNLIFCSDCFLYNRESLITELGSSSLVNSGDSQLAFMAFKKWGYSFVEKLRGIFSFAIYDKVNEQLHIYSDHFSRKYVVYHNNQDYICFSTTYKPVLACIGNKVKISHEFIVNSFRDITPLNFFKEAVTPYENVFHLDYATHITINLKTGKESRLRYWNPLKTTKKLKLTSETDYKTAFRTLFEKQTKSMLRSKEETGIFLSGGLDSSSVAAFAAPMLKKTGKNLYSYTSVPSSDYVDTQKKPNNIIDETPLVEAQKRIHSNLVPHYINGDNDSGISYTDFLQGYYDIPVKASINGVNIINMIKAAKKDNCTILLSGENGNATISYGHLFEYMSLKATKFHFIKALKEMNYFCKLYRLSRKKYFKRWLKGIFDYYKKQHENHFFLKPEDEKKYKLSHPTKDAIKTYGNGYYVTEKQRNAFLIVPIQFIQKGFYTTHNELYYHYIQLDPTLTVEMVEFCYSLPLECFFHNGIERRLCREFLKDLLPEEITDMYKGYGVQAPDFDYRINRDIDKHKNEVFSRLNEPLIKEFLDPEKITKLTKELKDAAEAHNLEPVQCIQLTMLSSLGSFLKHHS